MNNLGGNDFFLDFAISDALIGILGAIFTQKKSGAHPLTPYRGFAPGPRLGAVPKEPCSASHCATHSGRQKNGETWG